QPCPQVAGHEGRLVQRPAGRKPPEAAGLRVHQQRTIPPAAVPDPRIVRSVLWPVGAACLHGTALALCLVGPGALSCLLAALVPTRPGLRRGLPAGGSAAAHLPV